MASSAWTFPLVLATAFLPMIDPLPAEEQGEDPRQVFAACEANKNPDASIDACTRLIEQEIRESARRQAIVLTFRGWAWTAKGDVQSAFTDFSAAINLNASFAAPYEARGDLLRNNDQCEEAVADYDKAIEFNPSRAQTYISRGVCLIDKNETDRAIADFDQVIKLDADNSRGLAALGFTFKGRVHLGKGDSDGAIADYDEAIRLAPKRASLYIDRGNIWSGKGDYARAIADYLEAIKLDEGNAGGHAVTALILKGGLHTRKGELDRAIADFDEAIRLDPKQAGLHVERAAAWAKKGDDERALADYDKAVELDPKDAVLFKTRGDFYREKGDYPRALKDYDEAIAREAGYLPAYSNRGLTRFYAGDFAKAVDDFKRVVDEDANAYSTLMLYLSRARAGRKDAASELTKTAGKLKAGEWPYPIVELYLGRKSAPAVEAAASKPEERCEAQFYIGELHLTRNARAPAMKALRAAVDTCPQDFIEHRGAVEELKRLK